MSYLSTDLQCQLERRHMWLSQCPFNPDLEQHLVGYARLMGMKEEGTTDH